MKRINNLYNQIISIENLQLADEKARKGKTRSYGVLKHDKSREQNILDLHKMLKEGTYKTSPYDIFIKKTPKIRKIYRLPYFPDRIAHHAVMNIMEPIWYKVFSVNSYSCIKGRGIHQALVDLKRYLKKDPEGTKYCLKIDIKKFYDNIDHDILKAIIRKKIKDVRLLTLLDEVIDSAPGVPIGNYLSQYFANLYLTYFDHWLKEVKGVKYYLRYADDIVILASNKEFLHSLFKDMDRYLREELKLEIKGNWQIFPVEDRGIDFVGYVFFHKYVLLRKSIKKNFARTLYKFRKRNLLIDKNQIASWIGWAKHCNSTNLLKKLNYESILRPTA